MMISARLAIRVQRGLPQLFAPGKQPNLLPIDNCFGLLQQHGSAYLLLFFYLCSLSPPLRTLRLERGLFSK
jgi:hypothetical protein